MFRKPIFSTICVFLRCALPSCSFCAPTPLFLRVVTGVHLRMRKLCMFLPWVPAWINVPQWNILNDLTPHPYTLTFPLP